MWSYLFDIARNNEELKKCILQFDKTRYIDNVMKFKRNIRLVLMEMQVEKLQMS